MIKKRAKEEIRPSTVKAVDKVVMLWTKVVSPPAYPGTITAEKLQYNSGSLLHPWSILKQYKKLTGGAVI